MAGVGPGAIKMCARFLEKRPGLAMVVLFPLLCQQADCSNTEMWRWQWTLPQH